MDKTTIHEVIPIGGSSLIPQIKNILQNIFINSTINTSLDPKEVVAIGAAIQGGIFSKIDSLYNYNLLDITNYSIGVELIGHKMSKIVKRYTPITIELKGNYINAYDYQTEIAIKVYEGENNDIRRNIYLGEFLIRNLPRKKAGEIHIEIEFNIDDNSILNAKAIEEENKDNYSEKKFELNKNNEIKVEDPKGLMEIINALREKENSLENVDIKLYIDTIKDSIIGTEKKIIELKENEEQNRELIKEKYKFIIQKLGSMIVEQLERNNEEYEKILILSYIKFYFNKISNYFKNYVDNSFKQQILKNNIEKIIKEIQFYEPKIIFEIIEDFSDDEFFFENGIIFLIQNLYGKLTEKIETKYLQLVDNDELEAIKKEIKNTKSLFNKLRANAIPVEIKYVPDYLISFRLKIEAIQFIRRYNNKINKNTRNELGQLKENYSRCISIDLNLLNDLRQLLNEPHLSKIDSDLNDIDNKPVYLRHRLYYVIKEYPHSEKILYNNDDGELVDFDHSFKKYEANVDFWNNILISYQKSIQSINNENLIIIYGKIIIAINKVKNGFNHN